MKKLKIYLFALAAALVVGTVGCYDTRTVDEHDAGPEVVPTRSGSSLQLGSFEIDFYTPGTTDKVMSELLQAVGLAAWDVQSYYSTNVSYSLSYSNIRFSVGYNNKVWEAAQMFKSRIVHNARELHKREFSYITIRSGNIMNFEGLLIYVVRDEALIPVDYSDPDNPTVPLPPDPDPKPTPTPDPRYNYWFEAELEVEPGTKLPEHWEMDDIMMSVENYFSGRDGLCDYYRAVALNSSQAYIEIYNCVNDDFIGITDYFKTVFLWYFPTRLYFEELHFRNGEMRDNTGTLLYRLEDGRVIPVN